MTFPTIRIQNETGHPQDTTVAVDGRPVRVGSLRWEQHDALTWPQVTIEVELDQLDVLGDLTDVRVRDGGAQAALSIIKKLREEAGIGLTTDGRLRAPGHRLDIELTTDECRVFLGTTIEDA